MNWIEIGSVRAASNRHAQDLRSFGFVMASAFGVLGALSLWRGKFFGPYSLGLGAAFLLVALVLPRSLAPIERVWTGFATLMSVVMTYVILTVLFFAVITPLGVAMRLCGRDALKLKKAPSTPSFWTPANRNSSGGGATKPF
jgi:hypothetical protein